VSDEDTSHPAALELTLEGVLVAQQRRDPLEEVVRGGGQASAWVGREFESITWRAEAPTENPRCSWNPAHLVSRAAG